VVLYLKEALVVTFPPSGRRISLVFKLHSRYKIPRERPLVRALKYGVKENGDFRPISPFISETVGNGTLVAMDH